MKLQQGIKASHVPLCLQSLLRTRLENQDVVVFTTLNMESLGKKSDLEVQRYHSAQMNETWQVTKSVMKRDPSFSTIALTPSRHHLDAASLYQHPHPDVSHGNLTDSCF